MWFLRHKINPNNKHKFFALCKVGFVVLLVHALILFFIFYDRLNKNIDLTIRMSSFSGKSAPVALMSVVMPASVALAQNNKTSSIANLKKITAAPVKTATVKKEEAPKKSEKKIENNAINKPKEQLKKVESTPAEKVQQPKKELPLKIPEPLRQDEVPLPMSSQSDGPLVIDSSGVLPAYMQELRDLIGTYFETPMGVAADCICQVALTIDNQGAPNIVEMQRSKALIFDSCVQKTLYEIPWPRWVYGKTLQLTFTAG